MKNIILFGGGHHVLYCIDTIEKEGKYRIAGISDTIHPHGSDLYGYKVIGRQDELLSMIKEYDIEGGLITIGDNWIRKYVYDAIISIKPDFSFVNTIHPSAVIGRGVTMGRGNLIMAGSIVGPDAVIGNNTFMGSNAILEHGSIMADFASLSTGAITGGLVELREYCAITLGVTLIDRVKIGVNTVIGSGSLVMNDIPDNVLAYGVPAKIIRERKAGERFLK